MRPISLLLLPPRHLSSCIFAAIVRDTRGVSLNNADRLNHFPASPLMSVTCIIEGELRLLPDNGSLDDARWVQPMSRLSVIPPQNKPVTSWSPGPVAAVTVGIFPDAWLKLEQGSGGENVPETLANTLRVFEEAEDAIRSWAAFCKTFAPHWQNARMAGGLSDWSGSNRLADWSRSLLRRAVLA